MKKTLTLILAILMILALTACGQSAKPAATPTPAPSAEATEEPAPSEEPAPKEEPAPEEAAPKEEAPAAESGEVAVMSFADFTAAAVDDPVCIETYVQAKQSWWQNVASVYAQDEDGAYFLYNMACSEEDYAKLVPGQKLRVTGYKAEWSGEVEVVDASFELLDDSSFLAKPVDVTDLLGKEELAEHINQLVSFSGMTVEAYDDTGAAFAYKNEADKTDDLYFKVSKDGKTYDFCVEYYLCNEETDVYKAVEGLAVGDTIDAEGFLYWYNGVNPHITKITKK